MTRIYACFPGTGKTTLYKELRDQIKISDSDSSHFSWIVDGEGNKIRNPQFVEMYTSHIKSLIEQGYDVVFVSTHKEVIQGLIDAGIEFVIIKPHRHLRDAYIERYKSRGSDDAFVQLMHDKWDAFLDDIESANAPKITLMREDSHVSTAINLPL